ncbi:MAG: gamma-glutamyltransferase [Bacteroidota bacterium]
MKTKGIIAAGHLETANAGAEMLAAGGNAFDAALAAMLASFVAESSLTSLAGGGFMTAYSANGQSGLFDFFVQTPKVRQKVEDMDFVLSQINFGSTTQAQYIGRGSAAVPGCPAGLFAAHKALGTMPMEEIAAPAIRLAREGVLITPYQEYSISILNDVLGNDESCRAIFYPGGEIVKAGDVVKRPLLADTLYVMAKEGVRLFYEGEIAQAYAKDSEENGGSISLEDLQAYRVIERRPLRYHYHGYDFLTNPRPSAGGSMITYGLDRLAQQSTLPESRGPAFVKLLSQTMHEMEVMRQTRLRKGMDWLGNTTHISVLDEHGNAASITTTLGGASGRTIPGTGVLTNNMLGEMDLHPEGFYQWPTDQRVSSMMSPSILLKDGRPSLVLGSGGSSRIRTAILQTIMHYVDHGMSVEEAVAAPRLHWEAGKLNLEPGVCDEQISIQTLEGSPTEIIERWESSSMFFGGVHSVARSDADQLSGMADPRRDGATAQV